MAGLNHEKVLRLLQSNAASVLNSFDEPMAVMFVVAWKPGLGELPFGSIQTNKDLETTPELLANCIGQTSKLLVTLTQGIGQKTQEILRGLEKEVRSTQGTGDDKAKDVGPVNISDSNKPAQDA